MSGREEMLARIRAATADRQSSPEAAPAIPSYRRSAGMGMQERLERLIERLADYGATVLRVGVPAEIAACAAAQLGRRGIASLAVPADLDPAWLPEGVAHHPERGLTPAELDAVPGAMTGCLVAIAETGSLVLDGGPGQGRRILTLLPDYHLCVVLAEQVVGILPEAVDRMQAAAAAGRPLTIISGPSATADIELDRVQGVHGPRTLDVILVG